MIIISIIMILLFNDYYYDCHSYCHDYYYFN